MADGIAPQDGTAGALVDAFADESRYVTEEDWLRMASADEAAAYFAFVEASTLAALATLPAEISAGPVTPADESSSGPATPAAEISSGPATLPVPSEPSGWGRPGEMDLARSRDDLRSFVDGMRTLARDLSGAIDASLLAAADAEYRRTLGESGWGSDDETQTGARASNEASLVAAREVGAELVDVLRALEEVKNAASAAQGRATIAFDVLQRADQLRAGVPRSRLGKSVADQIGLARRESPSVASRKLNAATVVCRSLPRFAALYAQGLVTEEHAQTVVRESAFLDADALALLDEALSKDPEALQRQSMRQLRAKVREFAYATDPHAYVKRLEKAPSERFVSLRPAADGMTWLTALLPLRQGVSVFKALTNAAQTAMAAGDDRSKAQLMADTLVHRLTSHVRCPNEAADAEPPSRVLMPDPNPSTEPACVGVRPDDPDLRVDLIMTDRALFDGGGDPARIPGYDPIPAPLARAWINALPPPGNGLRKRTKTFLRRVFTHPQTGALVALESRARLFPDELKDFLRLRDQRCRTPWCDAPIGQADHIVPHTTDGKTTAVNGEGLCVHCNLAKEAPGWHTRSAGEQELHAAGPAVHQTVVTTPTGHSYTSSAPALPGDPAGP